MRLQEYTLGLSNNQAVDELLKFGDPILLSLNYNLTIAQDCIIHQAYKNCLERQLMVGDWVYLRLQPYRQILLVAW